MSFEEYCRSKKIDPALFSSAEPDKFQDLQYLFDQVSPNSFTQQKLFIINDIRRKYQLKTIAPEKTTDTTSSAGTETPTPVAGGIPKPAFKPKFK